MRVRAYLAKEEYVCRYYLFCIYQLTLLYVTPELLRKLYNMFSIDRERLSQNGLYPRVVVASLV